jgi:hypothetical protein
VFESTEIFTPPFWTYRTLSQGSPWLKMTSAGRYSTIVLAIPAESRNARASKVSFGFESSAGLFGTAGAAADVVDRLDGRRRRLTARTRPGWLREPFTL